MSNSLRIFSVLAGAMMAFIACGPADDDGAEFGQSHMASRVSVSPHTDFDATVFGSGDYTDDIATVYNYGGTFQYHVFRSNKTYVQLPASWMSATANWNDARHISGDFNNDGRSDVGFFYNYGSTTGIWLFPSSGSGFYNAAPTPAWQGTLPWPSFKPFTGDFNADGWTDVGAIYEMSGGVIQIWVWLSRGEIAPHVVGLQNPRVVYQEPSSGLIPALSTVTPVPGEYNGDTRSDVVLASFDPATKAIRLDLVASALDLAGGGSFSYLAGSHNWTASASVINGAFLGGRFTKYDSNYDIAFVANNGSSNVSVDVFVGYGQNLGMYFNNPYRWWVSPSGGLDFNKAKFTSGDYTGLDSSWSFRTDIAFLYENTWNNSTSIYVLPAGDAITGYPQGRFGTPGSPPASWWAGVPNSYTWVWAKVVP